MGVKNWIMIKRGLSEDPKHREAMGVRIWLFMHIIDRANWDTGIVPEWRDQQEADDMAMPWRTLQEQRQALEGMGYITCLQHKGCQSIIIHEWVNPRNYSGGVLNSRKQGTESSVPLDSNGTGNGTGNGSRKPRTPSIVDQVIIDQVIDNAALPREPRPPDLHFEALADITNMTPPQRDWKKLTRTAAGQLARYAKELRDAGATPDQIHGFRPWFKKHDWRGKEGQWPTPADVVKLWSQYLNGDKGNGSHTHRSQPTPEHQAHLQRIADEINRRSAARKAEAGTSGRS